jgi:methyltransferase (TIGR00027 family)
VTSALPVVNRPGFPFNSDRWFRTVRGARNLARVRTDHDSWDITTSVGSTALLVAAARALEAQKAEPLALDPYAELFCRAAGGEWADVLDGGELGSLARLLGSDFGAHFVSFQAARTKYFDAYSARLADAGVRQIVVLAAGLDSRAYRLPWPEGTVVYELDQPQVLRFKHDMLAQHGDWPTADRREVAVDLRDDWAQDLQAAGFDPSQPSAWIAEGLLVYLPATAQQQLFLGIDVLSAPGSWVAVEEGRPMPPEMFAAKQEEERDAGGAATFFNLTYNEQHAPAAEWFGTRGWEADSTPLPEYLEGVGRAISSDDPTAGPMIGSINLVTAIKGWPEQTQL